MVSLMGGLTATIPERGGARPILFLGFPIPIPYRQRKNEYWTTGAAAPTLAVSVCRARRLPRHIQQGETGMTELVHYEQSADGVVTLTLDDPATVSYTHLTLPTKA